MCMRNTIRSWILSQESLSLWDTLGVSFVMAGNQITEAEKARKSAATQNLIVLISFAVKK